MISSTIFLRCRRCLWCCFLYIIVLYYVSQSIFNQSHQIIYRKWRRWTNRYPNIQTEHTRSRQKHDFFRRKKSLWLISCESRQRSKLSAIKLAYPASRTIGLQCLAIVRSSLIGLYNGRQYNLKLHIYCLLDDDDGCCCCCCCCVCFSLPVNYLVIGLSLCLYCPYSFGVRALTIYVMCYFP